MTYILIESEIKGITLLGKEDTITFDKVNSIFNDIDENRYGELIEKVGVIKNKEKCGQLYGYDWIEIYDNEYLVEAFRITVFELTDVATENSITTLMSISPIHSDNSVFSFLETSVSESIINALKKHSDDGREISIMSSDGENDIFKQFDCGKTNEYIEKQRDPWTYAEFCVNRITKHRFYRIDNIV